MAKLKKMSTIQTTLKLNPKFLNCRFSVSLGRFGKQLSKEGKDFSLDELAEFWLISDQKTRGNLFLGILAPDYISPFDSKSKFPKINEDEDQ